jgi:hypothetical protein
MKLVNVAPTLLGPDMVRFWGVAVPVRLPVKPANWKVLAAEALTETVAPALYHPLAGAMLPPPLATAVVKAYCVVYVAVYVVADAGIVTLCKTAPPWLHEAKTYRVPASPCVAAFKLWLVPGTRDSCAGVVYAVPSTNTCRPEGRLVTVVVGITAKLAVTVLGPFRFRFCGVVVPERSPLKPVK